MNALEWLRDKFNGVYQDEKENEYDNEEYVEVESPLIKDPSPGRFTPKGGKRGDNVINYPGGAAYAEHQQPGRLVISKPRTIEDASSVSDCLRDNMVCVINLEEVDYDTAQRIADFIGGASFALSCVIERVSNHIFLVVPPSVQVTNELKDEIRKSGTGWGKFAFK